MTKRYLFFYAGKLFADQPDWPGADFAPEGSYMYCVHARMNRWWHQDGGWCGIKDEDVPKAAKLMVVLMT